MNIGVLCANIHPPGKDITRGVLTGTIFRYVAGATERTSNSRLCVAMSSSKTFFATEVNGGNEPPGTRVMREKKLFSLHEVARVTNNDVGARDFPQFLLSIDVPGKRGRSRQWGGHSSHKESNSTTTAFQNSHGITAGIRPYHVSQRHHRYKRLLHGTHCQPHSSKHNGRGQNRQTYNNKGGRNTRWGDWGGRHCRCTQVFLHKANRGSQHEKLLMWKFRPKASFVPCQAHIGQQVHVSQQHTKDSTQSYGGQ